MAISRRQFLESAALSTLAAHTALGAEVDKKSGMPTRILGKTGARVSVLAFGCGSRFLSYPDDEKAAEALTKALDLGITYVDTAYGYGNGKSETRVGQVIPPRRKDLWLATKIDKRGYDDAMRIFEGSLKRLNTDHLDLTHIHSLTTMEDLAEAENGVLKALYKLREQKMTRFIGVTSHTDPVVLKTALERHDFDCTQMALNAARAGMASAPGGMKMNDLLTTSFEQVALPVALKKKMGVIAMKLFAQERLVGKAPIDKLIQYSMSLPVSVCVAGMPKLEFIDHNISVAKSFKPMPAGEMKEMSDRLAVAHKASIDRFFSDHIDA
jgi:aryl-alcohol dehydrogenase-like predicted oxidoreductase